MKLKYKLLKIVMEISALFVFGMVIFNFFGAGEMPPPFYRKVCEDAFQRAEPIIQGINRYKTEKGHYPSDLKVLIPEYIKEIPSMPSPIYSFEGNAIEYKLLNTPGCQPFELKMTLERSALSSNVDLYYRMNYKLFPTVPSEWDYKYIIRLNKHWFYCY